MRGFPTTRFTIVFRWNRGRQWSDISDGKELLEEHKRMKKKGFTIDSEYDVYVREGYGAWKTNVDSSIKTTEDLVAYYEPILKKYIYKEEAEEMKQGYEYVIGPGAPADNGIVYGNGLYLRNYKELAEKINKEETKEEKGRCKKKGTK